MPVGLHAVWVGGADISCLVHSVTISHGRDDPGSQPEASSATIELGMLAPAELLPAVVDVGASVRITTQTALATYDRFVGRVSDLALGWEEAGEDTPDTGAGQIVAVGILAELGRRVVGDVPWPQELDGARVARVMAAAGITLDPAYSDPGTVQLLPRDVDATQALDVAQDAAVDGTGVLWQTRSGLVRYADADHRRGVPQQLALDSCDLLVTPTWRRTLEGLVNSVSIGYGAEPAGGGDQPRYTASSADSISRWGTYAYSSSTALAALADAQAQGNLLLGRNSSPVWVMAALPVDVAGLDAARYDTLLGLDMHSLLVLTGLPSLGTAPTSANLWVEGWKESLAWGAHELELVVTGYCRTAPPPRWDDVSPEWTWGGSLLSEARRNMLRNPGLTVDEIDWVLSKHGSYTGTPTGGRVVAGDGPPVGASRNYFRTTWPVTAARADGNGVRVGQPGYDSIRVTEGAPVTASVWVRSSLTTRRKVRGQLSFYGLGSDLKQPSVVGPTVDIGTGGQGWVLYTITGIASPGAQRMTISVPMYDEGGSGADPIQPGETWDVGCALVEILPSPALPYFDGDMPDTSTEDYAWSAAPGASQSVQSNIVTDPKGVPPTLTWDSAVCFGPPVNIGRWNDQPASLRWDQLDPSVTWDTYGTGAI